MPFPEGTPALLKGLYGAIESSVAARHGTAQLWQAIRTAAGGDLSGLGFRGAQTVSALRSIAAGVRDAEQRLATASLGVALDHRHVGVPPWARPIGERDAAPQFHIRFQALGTNTAFLEGVPGEPEFVSQWITLKTSTLPATVGRLNDVVAEKIAGMQTGRGQVGGYVTGPVVGVGRIQVLAA